MRKTNTQVRHVHVLIDLIFLVSFSIGYNTTYDVLLIMKQINSKEKYEFLFYQLTKFYFQSIYLSGT